MKKNIPPFFLFFASLTCTGLLAKESIHISYYNFTQNTTAFVDNLPGMIVPAQIGDSVKLTVDPHCLGIGGCANTVGQWCSNNVPIPNINQVCSYSFIVTSYDTITVPTCFVYQYITFLLTFSTNTINSDNSVPAYLNFNGLNQLQVKVKAPSKRLLMKVVDGAGKDVFLKELSGNSDYNFDFSFLKRGLYFVNLRNETIVLTEKIIKL